LLKTSRQPVPARLRMNQGVKKESTISQAQLTRMRRGRATAVDRASGAEP
jgi:hypothetical protein